MGHESTAACGAICQCGRPLPPAGTGRPRKWCSERCRKRSYAQPCERCGTPTAHGAETRRVKHPLCRDCSIAGRVRASEERVEEFVRLREDGLLNHEIAERCGVTSRSVTVALHHHKQRGGEVPQSPYIPNGVGLVAARATTAARYVEVWAEREQLLPELAARGVDKETIAEQLGVTPGSLVNIATKLRKRGVDVPRLRTKGQPV